MSNIVNKVKDAVSGHKTHDTTGTQSGSTTSSSNPNYYGSGSTNAGPHDTNIANKADPRVDSDRDGSRTAGTGNTYSSTTGTTGSGFGMGSSTGNQGYKSSGQGPHDSSLANKLDPRIDSTTGTSNTSGTAGMTGSTGYNTGSTNYGPHDSNVANKLDPRVDSDRDGSKTTGGTTYGTTGNQGVLGSSGGSGGMMGSGNKTTTGPHESDWANKLDPRVDSDLDGSQTLGSGQKRSNY